MFLIAAGHPLLDGRYIRPICPTMVPFLLNLGRLWLNFGLYSPNFLAILTEAWGNTTQIWQAPGPICEMHAIANRLLCELYLALAAIDVSATTNNTFTK